MASPVASEDQRERLQFYISSGKTKARPVAGGRCPEVSQGGWFVEPMVFADAGNSVTIAREEVFGLVLSIILYETEEDAIALANNGEFGLGSSV